MPIRKLTTRPRAVALADALESRLLLAASPVELVYDLDPRNHGSIATTAHQIVTIGNVAYFNPDHAPDCGGIELWRSDGPAAGTYRVKDIYPGDRGSDARALAVAGSTLCFIATSPAAGGMLWKSDGTE